MATVDRKDEDSSSIDGGTNREQREGKGDGTTATAATAASAKSDGAGDAARAATKKSSPVGTQDVSISNDMRKPPPEFMVNKAAAASAAASTQKSSSSDAKQDESIKKDMQKSPPELMYNKVTGTSKSESVAKYYGNTFQGHDRKPAATKESAKLQEIDDNLQAAMDMAANESMELTAAPAAAAAAVHSESEIDEEENMPKQPGSAAQPDPFSTNRTGQQTLSNLERPISLGPGAYHVVGPGFRSNQDNDNSHNNNNNNAEGESGAEGGNNNSNSNNNNISTVFEGFIAPDDIIAKQAQELLANAITLDDSAVKVIPLEDDKKGNGGDVGESNELDQSDNVIREDTIIAPREDDEGSFVRCLWCLRRLCPARR